MYALLKYKPKQVPWNKGKLVGQKPPLKLREIWAIRIRLQIDKRHRDLALFNLAAESTQISKYVNTGNFKISSRRP